MPQFQITDHVDFDAKGRAQCPSCLQDGKTNKNLSLLDSGAYKCHRGCTSDEIRAALGAQRDRTLPPPTATAAPGQKKMLLNPQKVKAATDKLLGNSPNAIKWLASRGINEEMIRHYRLGAVRARVGDSSKPQGFVNLPAIAISIPNHDGTAYFHKKRVRPWKAKEEQPDGYKAWSQYGIPAMVYTTHAPASPRETWLCEGEWDAIVLGWAVRHSELKNDVQVSCFTCGAGNVPSNEELFKLRGTVVTLYDRDEAGAKGANAVGQRLKDRVRVGTVPAPQDVPKGWDISDAMDQGLFTQIVAAVAAAKPWEPAKEPNPLRDRIITNDEMLARAPDYTDWLVDDILTSDELFLLAASPRAGKSLLAFTLAQAVATGGRFLERPVAQGAVIYIRAEDSDTKAKEREQAQGWTEGMPVYWLERFKLHELDHLEELIEELGVRLVVFDTLSRIRDASVSESSAEMSQLLEPIQEMCKRQRCCGLLVHHTGKVKVENLNDLDIFETIRGSSAIRATCRGTLILAAGENTYRLAIENGWGKLDLQVRLNPDTLKWRLAGNWSGPKVEESQKDRVLNYLNQVGSAQLNQIAEAVNLPKRSLYEVLKRLQCDGLVEKRGERKAAVYIRRAIQQIQQLNKVLNSSNIERERVSPSIQQNTFVEGIPEKVILDDKSDPSRITFKEHKGPPVKEKSVDKKPETPSLQGIQDSTLIQLEVNTDKDIAWKPVPESVSADVANSTKNGKSDPCAGADSGVEKSDHSEEWVFHIELETLVRIVKHGPDKTLVSIPGVGRCSVVNSLLKPVEEGTDA